MIIKDILVPGLATIDVNETMLEAKNIMSTKGFRHLPVSDKGRLVGMISDRDLKLAEVVGALGFKDDPHIHSGKLVSEYMSSPIYKARVNDRVEHVVRNMLNLKISSIVVEDSTGKDIGIVTTEDLLIVFLDVLDKGHSFFSKLWLGFHRKALLK